LDADIKKLKEIDAEIDTLKITVESAIASPHYSMMKHKGPIQTVLALGKKKNAAKESWLQGIKTCRNG